jgi:hypothetical protein
MTATGSSTFDYKFTEAEDADVTEAYRGQMELYCKAARKAFPKTKDPEIFLIVVSARKVRLVPLQGS